MPRSYNKKSDYWEKRKESGNVGMGAGTSTVTSFNSATEQANAQTINFETIGVPFHVGEASCYSGTTSNRSGWTVSPQSGITNQQNFANLRSGFLPYANNNGNITVSDAIYLCQLAYANVSVFKNTIDVMTEFSNSKLHLRGGSAASRRFFEKWFQKVGLYQFKEEFFREYYRSGNVFIYKVNGQFSITDYIKLQAAGISKNQIPVKYIIVNPVTVAAQGVVSYDFSYVKLLSTFEIEKIRKPKTDEEKALRAALPAYILKQIDMGGTGWQNIYMPLKSEDVYSIFYKKQSYEPFAIPMGYPVLPDIEWKLSLKKMDMALSRTVENIILLVTMGAEKDKGGINYKNIAAMQELFRSQAAGRVIVSDYTTKAEFVIPKLEDILGPEKYQVVDNDIKEGLQNILHGSEKFANQFIKTKVFLERLSEGQECFLNNFLIPEMQKICDDMGFRDCPTPKFEQVDLKDEVQFAKVVTRLAEIGIITGEQAIETLESGLYPDVNEMEEKQGEYKKLRDKGLFNPLLGGAKQENGRPGGTKAPQTTKNVGVTGSGKASIDELYSLKEIQGVYAEASKLEQVAEGLLKKKYGVKKLNDAQKDVAFGIAKNIISSNVKNAWETALASFIQDEKMTEDAAFVERVAEVSTNLELDRYNAAILLHSKVSKMEENSVKE